MPRIYLATGAWRAVHRDEPARARPDLYLEGRQRQYHLFRPSAPRCQNHRAAPHQYGAATSDPLLGAKTVTRRTTGSNGGQASGGNYRVLEIASPANDEAIRRQ